MFKAILVALSLVVQLLAYECRHGERYQPLQYLESTAPPYENPTEAPVIISEKENEYLKL